MNIAGLAQAVQQLHQHTSVATAQIHDSERFFEFWKRQSAVTMEIIPSFFYRRSAGEMEIGTRVGEHDGRQVEPTVPTVYECADISIGHHLTAFEHGSLGEPFLSGADIAVGGQ